MKEQTKDGLPLTENVAEVLTAHGFDPATGRTLEEVSRLAADRAKLFAGDPNEPFTDGETPETALLRAERKLEQSLKRRNKRKRGFEAFQSPARKSLAHAIGEHVFSTELAVAEKAKCKDLFGYYGRRAAGEGPTRKWVSRQKGVYARVQFMASNELVMVAQRGASRYENIFRIADMARHLYWRYTSPGRHGVVLNDSYLNLSLQRTMQDCASEPKLVMLLETLRDTLLTDYTFSEENLSAAGTLLNAGSKHRTRTLTDALLAMETKLLGDLATLRADLTALTSHHTTAHGVTVQRLNDIQDKALTLEALRPMGENVRALSTAVEVHKQNLITVLNITRNLDNRLAALEEKKQCLNVADSVMPEAEIVP